MDKLPKLCKRRRYTKTDEELRDLLIAISVVSKRMANKIELNNCKKSKEGGKSNESECGTDDAYKGKTL